MINEYNMTLGNKAKVLEVIYNLGLNLQFTWKWSFYLLNFDEEVGKNNRTLSLPGIKMYCWGALPDLR